MIEILPKVKWLQDLDEEYQAFPLLVSEDVNHISSFREALDLLLKDQPLVMLKKNKTYRVGSLVYINAPNNLPFNLRRKEKTRVSDAFIRPDSINYLRERLLVISGNNLNFNTKRIFFARRTNRRNYNQDEVFAVFEKEGFMKVFMEDLSLREQIDLMSNAEIIAGPTGAAWTNLIFCTEGTKCFCWMAEEFKEFSGYSNLAYIVGADLRYITYKAGTQSSRDLYELAYHLDIKKIENALPSLLKATS
jgi:capsular polysaccharide biosynthesis protein